MASAQSQLYIAERVEIHKSCKSLETLLNVLNDYCEAAGAVVILQKKLVKALRDTANAKVTNDIASNALNASANIFDALSEIDSKFAKIADKEYDGISTEVKKWFKKLAKEEKAHDDRITNANARIKQAGQVYEKKSKKNPREAAEEHARYMNLISTLGPEISQEKYNHAFEVTQRHTIATYSVAACASRVADAEWLRTCEGVRRFSPTIGPLGEWRALCEGGWTGETPPDLIDPYPDDLLANPEPESVTRMRNVDRSEAPVPSAMAERGQTPSPIIPRPTLAHLQHAPPSSFDPPRPLVDPYSGSVRSLSAFPSPPTHFPIPPRQPQSQQASTSSSSSNANFPAPSPVLELERQAEEPGSMPPSPSDTEAQAAVQTPPAADAKLSSDLKPIPEGADAPQNVDISATRQIEIQRPVPVRSQTALPNLERISSPVTSGSVTPKAYATARGDYLPPGDERQDTLRSLPGLQRSDTGLSSGSAANSIRNRYTTTSGATSPPPKDMPRLPLSVSDLATRYQSVEAAPGSPKSALPPTPTRQAVRSPGPSSRAAAEEEAMRRRTQLEREFAAKEREIALKAQELEMERAQLRNLQPRERRESESSVSSPKLRPRERKTSFRNSPLPRPHSQMETRQPSGQLGAGHAHSYSTTHLVPPVGPQSPSSPRSSTSSADGGINGHAPSCGCEKCSIVHYKSPSGRTVSPYDLRPPEKPFALRPEKPKGWIRRLSMPVTAFTSDKKNAISSPKMYSLDASKRSSATALRGVDELGISRRSYDASAVSNRSVTSLVGGLRR